jgi:hypothetical protein
VNCMFMNSASGQLQTLYIYMPQPLGPGWFEGTGGGDQSAGAGNGGHHRSNRRLQEGALPFKKNHLNLRIRVKLCCV